MTHRLRRLRRTPALREAVAETRLHAERLIQGHFVMDSSGEAPVESMPGISRMGIKKLCDRVAKDLELGITNILLFGVTEKDRKSTRLNSSHIQKSRMPSSA